MGLIVANMWLHECTDAPGTFEDHSNRNARGLTDRHESKSEVDWIYGPGLFSTFQHTEHTDATAT